jgi:hypothetical protein
MIFLAVVGRLTNNHERFSSPLLVLCASGASPDQQL